jgi:hypothetical protein
VRRYGTRDVDFQKIQKRAPGSPSAIAIFRMAGSLLIWQAKEQGGELVTGGVKHE